MLTGGISKVAPFDALREITSAKRRQKTQGQTGRERERDGEKEREQRFQLPLMAYEPSRVALICDRALS